MVRKVLAATVAAVLALGSPAFAQTPSGQTPAVVAQTFSIATASAGTSAPANAAGTSPWLSLSGQGSCAITFTSTSSGATVYVQGASDSPNAGTQTPQTVTTFGTAGVITSPAAGSAFGANVAQYALTFVRVNVTALSSGSVSGSLTCSTAPLTMASGAVGNVNVVNTPLPVSGSFTPSGTQNVAVTNPASSPVPVTAATTLPVSLATLPPIAFATTQPVSIQGAVTTTTTFPYNAGSTGQTGTTSSFLGVAGQYFSTPPVLTNGQVLGLTLNASGALKTDGSAVTQPVSIATTIPVSIATTVPVSIATLPPIAFATTQPVSIQSSVPLSVNTPAPCTIPTCGTTTVLADGVTNSTLANILGNNAAANTTLPNRLPTSIPDEVANGSATSTGAQGLVYTNGKGTFSFILYGTFAATTTVQGITAGGISTLNLPIYSGLQCGVGATVTSVTVAGNYCVYAAGSYALRLNVTYTSGTMNYYEIMQQSASPVIPTQNASGATSNSVCDPTTASQCAPVKTAPADGTSNTTSVLGTQAFVMCYNGTTWDRCRKDSYAAGPVWVTTGGSTTVNVPTNATTVVKASAGRLARILVTTLGAGTLNCYDNASTGSGTVIGTVAASAAIGTVEQIDMPAANGITCVSSATGPVATVSFY